MYHTAAMARTTMYHTVRARVLAAVTAIAVAVALPQVFHILGAISGSGAVPGKIFLPMHLPILLVGLLAGPATGFAAGVLGPVVSFILSGMPGWETLPFMVVELAGYGLAAGLLATVKLPTLGKLLLAQLAGRGVRLVAVLIAVYVLGMREISLASVWTAWMNGLPGLLLQWSLLPLLVFWVEQRENTGE